MESTSKSCVPRHTEDGPFTLSGQIRAVLLGCVSHRRRYNLFLLLVNLAPKTEGYKGGRRGKSSFGSFRPCRPPSGTGTGVDGDLSRGEEKVEET